MSTIQFAALMQMFSAQIWYQDMLEVLTQTTESFAIMERQTLTGLKPSLKFLHSLLLPRGCFDRIPNHCQMYQKQEARKPRFYLII